MKSAKQVKKDLKKQTGHQMANHALEEALIAPAHPEKVDIGCKYDNVFLDMYKVDVFNQVMHLITTAPRYVAEKLQDSIAMLDFSHLDQKFFEQEHSHVQINSKEEDATFQVVHGSNTKMTEKNIRLVFRNKQRY